MRNQHTESVPLKEHGISFSAKETFSTQNSNYLNCLPVIDTTDKVIHHSSEAFALWRHKTSETFNTSATESSLCKLCCFPG